MKRKIIAVLVIVFTISSCSNTKVSVKNESNNVIESSVEMGRYIAATKGRQQLVYRVFDYCVKEIPSKLKTISQAKNNWNKRNLEIVNNWKVVMQNWWFSDGLSQNEATTNVKEMELTMPSMLEYLIPMSDQVINVIAAKPQEEKIKSCTFFVSYINGGAEDISSSPETIKIYNIYSSYIL
jgi:hypothetical protein